MIDPAYLETVCLPGVMDFANVILSVLPCSIEKHRVWQRWGYTKFVNWLGCSNGYNAVKRAQPSGHISLMFSALFSHWLSIKWSDCQGLIPTIASQIQCSRGGRGMDILHDVYLLPLENELGNLTQTWYIQHNDQNFLYGPHVQILMFSITHPSLVLSTSLPTCQTVSPADCSSWSAEPTLSFSTTITIPRPVLNVLANSACQWNTESAFPWAGKRRVARQGLWINALQDMSLDPKWMEWW